MKKISITQYGDAYREVEMFVPDEFEVQYNEIQFTEEDMDAAADGQGIGWEIGGATGEYMITDVEEEAQADFLNDKMATIDNLIDPLMERLTARNGGVDPQSTMSIPKIVEWAGDKYGYDDPDVAELRQLAEDYDHCREQLAELQ